MKTQDEEKDAMMRKINKMLWLRSLGLDVKEKIDRDAFRGYYLVWMTET